MHSYPNARFVALLIAGAMMSASANSTDAVDDGTLISSMHALQWKRCAEGQRWENLECRGIALPHNWEQAQGMASVSRYAGLQNWRLPTLNELRLRRTDGGLVTGLPHGEFWTGQAVAHGNDGAFVLNLTDHKSNYAVAVPSESHSVLLVRDLR